MNKKIVQLLLVIAGALLFNMVFWQEKPGINMVLFDAFLLSALSFLYPKAGQHAVVRWLLVGHLFCLAMIVVHNTLLSQVAFTVTLLLLTAFIEYAHRSVWFAGGSVLMNILLCSASITEQFRTINPVRSRKRNTRKFIRFAIFPLSLLAIFFIIYLFANSIFQEMAAKAGVQLERFLFLFINLFSWQRLLFMALGIYLTATILLKSRVSYFSNKETNCHDHLQRARKKRQQQPFYQLSKNYMGRLTDGMLALKNENTTGLISLFLLNTLLAVINTIDISCLWFNVNYQINKPAYKMVHEGTELLILSVILAMMVVLFFFKGNLNFYKRNKWLKYGATAWIVQNAVLVVSVLVRDYYYINRHGLAYKRIGVLFFLLMVFIGLVTMSIKIWQRRTTYFLLRVNAWAGIVVLVLASAIHWDELIVGYNLKQKDNIELDVPFLLSLSDKTLPLLDRNRAVLLQKQQAVQQSTLVPTEDTDICSGCYIQQLEQREKAFLASQRQLSWLSWNYADEQTIRYLLHKTSLSLSDTNR